MVKFGCGTYCSDDFCIHFRSEDDTMQTLDTLAAHYVQEANKEKKSEKKRELFTKATVLVTTADKIVMHNARSDHFCAISYRCQNVKICANISDTCWDVPFSASTKATRSSRQTTSSTSCSLRNNSTFHHCWAKLALHTTRKITGTIEWN